jgi:hypothetical protein
VFSFLFRLKKFPCLWWWEDGRSLEIQCCFLCTWFVLNVLAVYPDTGCYLISSFFHKAFRDISYILGEVTFSRRFLWCFSRPRDTGSFVSLFQINHRSDRDLEPNQQAFTSSHFPILFANSVTMCLSLPDTCRRQCIMVVVMVCLETIWRQMSLLDSSFLLEALRDFHKDVTFRLFLRRLARPRDTGTFVSPFQINHRSDRDLEPNQQAFTMSHFPILFPNAVSVCLSLHDTCRRECITVAVMECLETICRQM